MVSPRRPRSSPSRTSRTTRSLRPPRGSDRTPATLDTGTPRHRPAVSPARRVAYAVLEQVEGEQAYATPLLAEATETLRPDDRALCYELVLGCLRQQLWLDRLIEQFSHRKAERLDAPVRLALRLGLYQLRFLDRVPDWAAVDESVSLAQAAGRTAAGFTNAVLRHATREPDVDPAAGIRSPEARLAVQSSHPEWLIRRWIRAFGWDTTRALAQADNQTPPVAFRLTRSADTEAVLAALRAGGVAMQPSRLTPGAWRVEGGGAGNAALRAAMEAGTIYLQDEASQLVAVVLGIQPGERVLDVCAAPGGKTTRLAALANDDARLVAGDLSWPRLDDLRELLHRQGLHSVSLVQHDATDALPFPDGAFDRVLLDAPCSGTGTLRRNPELRWKLAEPQIREFAVQQAALIREVARVVRPGGRLVYSTCSVEPEENERVVASFLAASPHFRLVPPAPAPLTPAGYARTWPHRDDTEGFFVVAFERNV